MTDLEKEQILDLRLKGVGYKAIAAVLGLSRDSVRGYCRRNGLDGDAKTVSLNVEEKKKQNLLCACCNKPIKQRERGRTRRFCSDACRIKWWNDHPDKRTKSEKAIYKYTCPTCQKEFSCYGNKRRKYCSHDCYIKSRFWNGDEDGI
ncbi:helix-turn-helix domain-containing protein [Paradesulfitobacterium ferrireducens]|uniref:helix-turn-helix domain-containing protein n=1 Tax=Paradesulfitobacterium ferrireducens TaxID=2816476 RepID=UPI001A8DF160|nr:helix-turn-helix domain-containing protein [Paradesulfitobacterium ferrireducens]